MAAYALPVLFALFVWWFSTGVILYLDGLPRRTFGWSMAGATGLLAAALYGLAIGSGDASVAGAYLAFTCGVLIWGWHEISFLMGFVTGPRTHACPDGCAGWRHFGHGVQAILYHELAILATAAVVVGLTWGGANQVGTWTFMILWGMRLSAKLNLFFGVPNLHHEFLPEHLQYLRSFLNKRPMNLLFPVSVTGSSLIALVVVQGAVAHHASAFQTAGGLLLATLLALAILEHWFLALPLPDAALWRWAMGSRNRTRPSAVKPQPTLLVPALSGKR
jgi:putative photosynthetic complex assembly protein 2